MASTKLSISAMLTASFSQAFSRPAMILPRSQDSRRPSFLMSMGSISSIRS